MIELLRAVYACLYASKSLRRDRTTCVLSSKETLAEAEWQELRPKCRTGSMPVLLPSRWQSVLHTLTD